MSPFAPLPEGQPIGDFRPPRDTSIDLDHTTVTNAWDTAATSTRLAETQAELGRTQAALAASQQDLTRMEAERDRAVEAADKMNAEWLDVKIDLALARDERDQLKAKIDLPCGSCHPCNAFSAARDRDLARAELASARQELDQLRARSAACHVTNCSTCGDAILCAEAREPLPGPKGYFRHVTCPAEAQGGEPS